MKSFTPSENRTQPTRYARVRRDDRHHSQSGAAAGSATAGAPAARGELDAVVGQHGVDAVGHGLDQVAQEPGGLHLPCAVHEADEGELARAVDGHEQTQLALPGADLGQVDVEVADGVGREALLLGLVALDFGQPADPMPLEAAMQR
jgi:hypothetical protein